MTNIELQNKLNAVISVLEDYDDNVELRCQPSTYFINSNFFIQVGKEGFIDLDLENLDDYLNNYEVEDEEDEPLDAVEFMRQQGYNEEFVNKLENKISKEVK